MRRSRTAAMLTAAALAVGVAACGEKEEPSAAELSSSTAAEETEEEFAVAGRWRGQLRQKGLKPFTATALITGPDGPNSVEYTGIDCAGKWIYEGRTGDVYSFNERIDRGKGGRCKGAGTVTLDAADPDRLGYEFTGGGVQSRGTLQPAG